VIEARDLFRIYAGDYGNAAALQGLTLNVDEGEILVVLGPSGSGKTTLLRILAGLDRPSAGSVRVLGLDLDRLSARALAAYRTRATGYADQHYAQALAPELTARQLVGVRLGLAGATRAERHRRADELLERVGLAERRDARPHELSGGEQQRVAICAAVSHRPRLLFADEPTGELDHASAARLYELLGELARAERCTTVVVSHDPESAAIADRIVHVRDGRLSAEWARKATEESIVVGRGGWLQLPEELLRRAAIGARATARLEGGAVRIAPAGGAVPGDTEPAPPGQGPSRGETVAVVRALHKRLGRGPAATSVFDGIEAEFASGQLTAVTGPSGSGKTTLLRLLAGLELPDEGDVVVLGTTLSLLDRAGRAVFRRRHLALAAQDPALVPFLSARENVELGLALRDLPYEDAVATLRAVGLEELAERRADSLSAGERARVAIARALASRPAILLADEPTARLDQANALAIGELLARTAQESGTAVVCATHDRCVIEQAEEELALGASAPLPVYDSPR
jgi:ABC-type lipoprotein export system ATPase subunit